ncbi:uncharacterized protein F5Z01DRAFT_671788 [Emericellopsis atlantica]|uniref:DUF8213 domain-containing protein n=1 Tax=Emericellopsis atlantica TaxID=2614577 RepID=A0A9P7ZRM1_9HYPO|nr:uncharacterized protein F5Z01DRAFT_671788 [Emericellopsis atlantica]KAG9256532.1 hypothetical protein F5Z01DRAFT_671788 [Emericellopsis atlantica]
MMLQTSLALAALASFVCASPAPATLDKRAISCVSVGTTATARWTNAAGKTCTFTGVVGSNFGASPSGSGDYSCNGRCGAGCSGTALGNAYTLDCFSHDICSYFNNASGGASDPNCGAAFNAAIDDTAFGAVQGCGQTNPNNGVSKPSNQPVCI